MLFLLQVQPDKTTVEDSSEACSLKGPKKESGCNGVVSRCCSVSVKEEAKADVGAVGERLVSIVIAVGGIFQAEDFVGQRKLR